MELSEFKCTECKTALYINQEVIVISKCFISASKDYDHEEDFEMLCMKCAKKKKVN